MRPMVPTFAFALLTFAPFLTTAAQGQSGADEKKANAALVAVQKLLDEALIDPKPFRNGMPFAKYLAAVEKQLPKGKKITLSIDEAAFGKDMPFLSRHNVYRYSTNSFAGDKESDVTAAGLAGITFSAQPFVNPERRYLRLQITQKAVELRAIDKIKKQDLFAGKEMTIEPPRLHKISVKGTIQIPDRSPILMPVNYRPSGKGSQDKVWLLMARPYIWIEEEIQELRKQGQMTSSKFIWESEVSEEERPAPKNPLPLNKDVSQILQAVIKDVLTNPELKSTREFYGTAKDSTFTLFDNESLAWPKKFKPFTTGLKYKLVQPDPFKNGRRVLGIRLDKFDLKEKKPDPLSSPIEICIFNAGGSANGGVIGGCYVSYRPKKVDGKWVVAWERIMGQ